MRQLIVASVLLLSLTVTSLADSISDANAGMNALKKGDFNTAIKLFGRAIDAGKLATADMESAYFERAQAYMDAANARLAVDDLDRALTLNPEDPDAQNLRTQAIDKLVGSPKVPPGTVMRDCPLICPELVTIPPGTFLMGSPVTEAGRLGNETQHRVIVSYSIAVAKTDVTSEQWNACVTEGGCSGGRRSSPDQADLPVINISWDDAQAYVTWLSKKTGQTYRLLSEAEWEYAARAGTTSSYYWGNTVGTGKTDCDGCGSSFDAKGPAPVASFEANRFGLYDMLGEVGQLTEDCAHDSYSGAPSDGSAWLDGACGLRVIRGGSWDDSPQFIRAASRSRSSTYDHTVVTGFRVARTL